MEKQRINNIAGVGIIFRAASPDQIFIEIKDDGYPMKVFRRCLCPVGGNWIGDEARKDRNPQETFCRELTEELSFEKSSASTLELALLGTMPEEKFYRVPGLDRIPTKDETEMLEGLKRAITESCTPFGDYLLTTPKSVLDKGDPENKHEGYTSLVSYWTIALNEEYWEQLVVLQRNFGNLSNESISVITSLGKIVSNGTKSAFGHDRPLQQFFLRYGFPLAQEFPMIDGIFCQKIGKTMASYQDYLKIYEVLKKPI